MTARRVLILLVAGCLVIAFAVWLSSKRHLEKATLAGDPVLAGFDHKTVNAVTEVRLVKAGGIHTTLKKGASDWTVAEREYPADSGKVRKLLLDLATLNVVEEKTRTPENYPLLGVEDVSSDKATGTRLDAVTPARTYSLIVGKPSGVKSGFVRVVNAQPSFLAGPQLTLDADPARWLDHTLIDISQERIREVAVKPAEGPGYTASRTSKDQPDFTVAGVPKGRELSSPAAADPIAGSLGAVTMDDVRKGPETPPTGVSHAIFRTFDGLEIDVAGRKDGTRTFISLTPRATDSKTAAQAQALATRFKGWEFELPSYKYDGLYRPLEELLKKPPEPAGKKPKGGAGTGAGPGAAVGPGPAMGLPPSAGPGEQQ